MCAYLFVCVYLLREFVYMRTFGCVHLLCVGSCTLKPAFFAIAIEVAQMKWRDKIGSREVLDNDKAWERGGAAVS